MKSLASVFVVILHVSTFTPAKAFVVTPLCQQRRLQSPAQTTSVYVKLPANSELTEKEVFDPLNLDSSYKLDKPETFATGLSCFLAALAVSPAVANANDSPNWGIFEGKTGSILHPIAMGSMFLLSVNTALKGFAWRKQRTMGDVISSLKKQVPPLPEEASSFAEAIALAKESGESTAAYEAALQAEREIAELTAERKALSSQNNRDMHYTQGALLAFIGTFFAIEGPLNTYARAGKLFPGPHLYAGAGLVVCWAAAAACTPFMQKGNDTARSIHIGANVLGLGLFAWQIQSGIPILTKVWELTKWP